MGENLVLRGTMRAHTDMVTAIAASIDNSDMIVSASRDKSITLWSLTKEARVYGGPRRRLTGHSHFVEDVVLSSDGQFALSGSWDCELRLWDLATGNTARRFVGHTNDVLSVAFSIVICHIVSASHDKSIKLRNTLGIPSRTPKLTVNGSVVSASALAILSQLLSQLRGTRLSRYGICPTVN